jgi:prepilin peptidase CpaA
MIRDLSSVVACVAIVGVAAACDLATRRIPNALTLGGIVLGIVLHTAVGFVDARAGGAFRGASFALIGMMVCAAIPLVAFLRGEMGGGDVKLFAAIGALAGPSLGIDAQAFTFVFALLVLWPWRLYRAGALGRVATQLWSKVAGVAPNALSAEPVRVAPVVLGPTILIALCVAITRHGVGP